MTVEIGEIHVRVWLNTGGRNFGIGDDTGDSLCASSFTVADAIL